MSVYNTGYGWRPRSNWGEGDADAPFAEGDIVFIPAVCSAVLSDRVDAENVPGMFRVISAFSIGEGPEWYFRVSPMRPRGRGDRWVTDDSSISDRLHVVPGVCDYMAGFTVLHTADPRLEPVSSMPSAGLSATKERTQ